MKVSAVNNIIFSSKEGIKNNTSGFDVQKSNKEIKELGYATQDFNVNLPVQYKKIAVDRLDNGLAMHRYKMANGYKVTIVPMKNSPAIVKSYVNVGSMNETSDIKGISHFLEHMAFNGTNGEDGHTELKQGDSFKMIEKMGGWTNASTNYAITDYVNSSPLLSDKDIETQIKVIAAMAEDLKLSEDMITKEKGPVTSEINMILDNPQTIAVDQTVRTLFGIKNPADELVGGSVSHIQNLTRKDVLDYYNKYYTPDNINIVITGDVSPDEVMKLVSKNFNSRKMPNQGQKFEEKLSPINTVVRKDFESDKATSAEIVIGFSGAKNSDTRDKILCELAATYLSSYEAGLMTELKNYNAAPLIGSEKISTNPNSPRFIYMMMSPSDSNVEPILRVVFDKLSNNVKISKQTTDRLKQRLKQENESILEHSSSVNDCVGYSVLDNDIDYLTQYNNILDSITPEELSSAIKKYFDISKSAITVVHPSKKNDLSFKGAETKRTPVDMSDVSGYKLSNNYEAAFYKSKSNNINLMLKLQSNIPYTKKAGVAEVLNELYTMGTSDMPTDKFNEFKDKNNLSIHVSANQSGISAGVSGDKGNYKLGLNMMEKLLFNPNINEKNIQDAVIRIKDRMGRISVSSSVLQQDFDTVINPLLFRRDDIINNLDSVTVDDVKELHQYIIKNSRGLVGANIPEGSGKEIENNILKNINNLEKVEPNKYRLIEVYKELQNPAVIKLANHNSQADISEVFRFKWDNSIKERAVIPVMNSILSSSSIGLFDNLREKENLAYSVHSNYSFLGDQGNLSLNILTTTDNQGIGTSSYDNVQKSINGFNRQIEELVNGKFTDEDLDIAKKSIKASLLNNEGNAAKIKTLITSLNSPYNLDLKNKIYEEVDNITRKDIIDYANKVFSNKPVYSIVASQDTINANEEFFETLQK